MNVVATGNDRTEVEVRDPAILVGVGAVVIGIGLAAWGAWTCDDAFISYRYARHLVEGHGLVYNVGERVEGYTNLLWTLWVALGLLLHVDAVTWSAISGLIAYGAVLLLLFAFHVELRQRLPVTRVTLPLACLAAAFHPEFHIFATSGLETSAFTAISFAGYSVIVSGIVRGKLRSFAAGSLFGVASMIRPDGMVFAAAAGAAVLAFPRNRARNVILFALAVGVFWSGTTLFRVLYYGEYFPNTYYAKSAYLAWHRQGFAYLATYLHRYWELYTAPFVVLWLLRKTRRRGTAGEPFDWFGVHAVLATVFAALYTYYVVRVGGDFMYGRLLVPVTPYLAILLELALQRLSIVRPIVYGELAFAALAMPVLTPRPVTGTDWSSGIADERAVYSDQSVAEAQEKVRVLAEFFKGLPVRIAFLGTEARIMYEANIPVAIESDTGLTDRTVARQPLVKRGRIGHEKRASATYLVEERKAHFMLAPRGPEDIGLGDYIPLTTIELGTVKAWIVYWDPAMMAELRRRGATFVDFGDSLDRYVAVMNTLTDEQVQNDYAKFRRFYFGHVDDPVREAAFKMRLRRG
jgi:hypothetical protein